MENRSEFEFRWIFGIIRRWWWLVLGFTILAAAGAYALTANMPPKYEASSTLLVKLGQDEKANEYTTLVAGERLALTYSEMLKSRPVLEDVINELGLEDTPEQLAKDVSAEPIKNTQLIRLNVTSASPEQAAQLTDAIARAFMEQIQEQAMKQYTASLLSMQERLDASIALIEETQAKTDALRANKIDQETHLTQLENLLAENRSDLRVIEQDYQSLKLTIAQLTDNVKIIDAATTPQEPIRLPYQAIVILLVDQAPVTIEGDYTSIMASERLASTYAEILTSNSILSEALARLELENNPASLAAKVKAEPIEGTQLIRLTVLDSPSARAVTLANTIAEVFISQIQALLLEPYADRLTNSEAQIKALSIAVESTQAEIDTLMVELVQSESELLQLENLLTEDRSDYRALLLDYEQQKRLAAEATQIISIAEPASPPQKSTQRRPLFIAVAAMAGALGSLGIAYLFEYLDDKLRTSEDVSRALGLVTVGVIGRYSKSKNGLVMVTQPLSPTAEALRTLVTNLRHASTNGPLRTLMVTSPSSKEGKTFTVANLATAFARSNLKVVVVDADLRLSNLHKLFGVEQAKGLTTILHEGVLDGRLQPTSIENLSVLTSGESSDNPAELMNSPYVRTLLDELAQQAELVLIDSPPVLPVADARILASQVDGVLLVVRAGSTRTSKAREAVRGLQQAGANLVGAILNYAPSRTDRYYRYSKEESKSFLKRWK